MRWVWISLGILFALFVLPNFLDLLLLPAVLLYGWFPAAKRLVVNAPFTGTEISVFIGGCVLLLAGADWFFRQIRTWRFRWTAAFAGTLGLVLVAIMSAVGAAHQLGWILVSSEPVFVERHRAFRDRIDLQNTAVVLAKIASTNDQPGAASAWLCDSRLLKTRDGQRPWEKYDVLFLNPTNEHCAIIWPRDARVLERVGAAVVGRDGKMTILSVNESRTLIRKAQTHVAENY